jgi:hypothetical protein
VEEPLTVYQEGSEKACECSFDVLMRKSIMPNLTASIPHQLGRAEAKRRIQEEVGNLRTHQGALVTHVEEKWTGDKLDFSLVAMGQTISGHLLVEDKMIHLDVALPWLLYMLAAPIRQQIEQRGQHLLGGPPDKK